MSIYADLLEFKRGILERIQRDLARLSPPARKAGETDLRIIEEQMHGYQSRLDLWYRRIWEFQELRLDPTNHVVQHKGIEASLTRREFQLLEFLLNHPHRYFTTDQVLGQAWAEPDLSPEEVRNYVRRLRKTFVEFGLPVDIVNKRGRGYSLILRSESRI